MNRTMYRLSIALNLVAAVTTGILVAELAKERSDDVVRVTVTSDVVYGNDIGPTLTTLERWTGREAYAVRLNGTSDTNATKWQLRIDDKSASNLNG